MFSLDMRRGGAGALIVVLMCGCEVGPEPETAAAALVAEVDAEVTQGPTALCAGSSLALVQDGRVVLSRIYGSHEVAATYEWASLTKTLTALMTMQMVEQGRLQLDAPIWTYVPRYRALIPAELQEPPLTLEHLLTHTGGLARDGVVGTDPVFVAPPGSGFRYSNAGFAIIGEVLAAVEARSFPEMVGARIATPGRLDSLTAADGYYAPAALVWSDIQDLAGYTVDIMQGRFVSSATLYDRMLVDHLPAPFDTARTDTCGQGLGFVVQGSGDDVVASHAGADGDARSYLMLTPRRGRAVVLFCTAPEPAAAIRLDDVVRDLDRTLAAIPSR